jgi:hypothetical protein
MTRRRQQTLVVEEATMERDFGLLGDRVIFQTNAPTLLSAAEASFGRFPLPVAGDPVELRLLLEDARSSAGEGVTHRFSGAFYVVSAPGGVAVADVRQGVGVGFVNHAVAEDEPFVRYTFVEGPALAMLTRSRGYLALHASGVARDGIGLALQGPEGAGKSTLAVACARRGIDVFAEDAVFVRAGERGLEFWGLPWIQRLLPDAGELFPELRGIEPRRQPNRESKLEVDLDEHYPGRARPTATPGAVVILERGGDGPTVFQALDGGAAAEAIEVLWPWEADWCAQHEMAAGLLDELPVYRLVMNGTPDDAVDALEGLLTLVAAGSPAA